MGILQDGELFKEELDFLNPLVDVACDKDVRAYRASKVCESILLDWQNPQPQRVVTKMRVHRLAG